MVKEMIGGCCVCSDERGWDENPLVYCDGHGCNVAVHQACYGIVQVPKGPWFCRKCESQERIARVKCELCPHKEGALKRTDTGGWAHVVCALYIPEVRFGNVTTMEPIILASVPHDRFCKTCYICEERGRESKTAHGACMSCNKTGCRHAFHVTCAQSSGLLCEENDGQSGPTVKYVGYCQFHWNRKAKGVLFNSKPFEKLDKSMKGVEKEKDKEVKEKDKLEKDKEKPKAKPEKEKDKDKKIPKPRLSTGASSSSSEQSPKPEVTAPNLQNPPSTPKQRGRKPSSAKTPTEIFDFKVVTSEAQKTASVVNDSLRQSPLPGLVPLPVAPVPTITSNSSIVAKETSPVPTQPTVLSPEMLPMSVSSQLKAIPQPSTSILVSDVAKDMNVAPVAAVAAPTKTSTFKETPKQPAAAAPPKKRAAPKNSNEPKRKVGRPPLKSKQSPSAANRKNSSPASTSSTVTSPLNTAFPSSFSQDSQRLASPPSYLSNQSPLFGASSSHGTGVPQNGPRTPSPNPYMIPQPRSRGQLENGHVLRPNNVNPSPLQLPTSLEELLEYQWEQGAQFLMQQASQYDVASLMNSLHQLKADNARLEERLVSLTTRKNQLLQVNARLATPMSCTNTSSTASPSATKQTTPNSASTAAVSTQDTLTADTRTTPSSEGPRSAVSACANGAAVLGVCPGVLGTKVSSVTEGKAPMSANTKQGSVMGDERKTGNGTETKANKTKDSSARRLEPSLSSTQSLSSASPKQSPKVSSVLVQPQHPGKLALPQPALANTQDKERQHQKTPTQVNAVQQIIVPTAVAVSKATQPRFQTQQKILLPQPPSVSQTFSTQPFSQAQPIATQQHVLLQLIKQQDDHHRQNSAFAHDKHQLGTQQVQASKLLPASVPGQPFSAHSLSLSYPGFVTVADPMAARVDMLKTTHLTPLSMVSLDTGQNGPKDRSQYFDLDKGANSADKTSRSG